MTATIVHWEIGGRDLEALTSFYRALFDWRPESDDPDYRMVRPPSGPGGGLMRCRDDVPPYVTIYVQVDDLDETLATVAVLGGTTLVPPTSIPDGGTFALFQDPEGNAVGLMSRSGWNR